MTSITTNTKLELLDKVLTTISTYRFYGIVLQRDLGFQGATDNKWIEFFASSNVGRILSLTGKYLKTIYNQGVPQEKSKETGFSKYDELYGSKWDLFKYTLPIIGVSTFAAALDKVSDKELFEHELREEKLISKLETITAKYGDNQIIANFIEKSKLNPGPAETHYKSLTAGLSVSTLATFSEVIIDTAYEIYFAKKEYDGNVIDKFVLRLPNIVEGMLYTGRFTYEDLFSGTNKYADVQKYAAQLSSDSLDDLSFKIRRLEILDEKIKSGAKLNFADIDKQAAEESYHGYVSSAFNYCWDIAVSINNKIMEGFSFNPVATKDSYMAKMVEATNSPEKAFSYLSRALKDSKIDKAEFMELFLKKISTISDLRIIDHPTKYASIDIGAVKEATILVPLIAENGTDGYDLLHVSGGKVDYSHKFGEGKSALDQTWLEKVSSHEENIDSRGAAVDFAGMVKLQYCDIGAEAA